MLRSRTKSDSGSAVLEVITFVLVGQLLVAGWLIQIAEQMDHKVRLQLFAATMARSIGLQNNNLQSELEKDLNLDGVKIQPIACDSPLICVSVQDESMSSIGVSHR
ncbi:MAG: hypothetical protein RL140_632 [Actinomycetota bacterium]|jgi:hypothetical protein